MQMPKAAIQNGSRQMGRFRLRGVLQTPKIVLANFLALLDVGLITSYFKFVVGYEDVPFNRQKPASSATLAR